MNASEFRAYYDQKQSYFSETKVTGVKTTGVISGASDLGKTAQREQQRVTVVEAGNMWNKLLARYDFMESLLIFMNFVKDVKDSFGNALVPFLLPHYEEIYIVDSRFYSIGATGKNIIEFIGDQRINEVLFIHYMENVNWHQFMEGVEALMGSS